MAQTVEEILASRRGRAGAEKIAAQIRPSGTGGDTVEDILTRQSGGRGPADLAAAIDLKGTAGSAQMVQPMTGRDIRQVGTAVAGVGAAAMTGGMAFLPALFIIAGTEAATDFGMRAIGAREEGEPGMSLEGAVESAKVGAGTIVVGGALQGTFRGAGLLGGVGIEGVEALGRRLSFDPVGRIRGRPTSAGRFLRNAPLEAEMLQSEQAGQFARNLLKSPRQQTLIAPRGVAPKTVTQFKRLRSMENAENLIDRIDDIYAANTKFRASAGISEITPGGLTPEALGAGVRQHGVVPMAPIKRHIRSLKTSLSRPEDATQNAALDEFADALPESMTLRDLTSYIRGLNEKVAEQIGNISKVPVSARNRIAIAGNARELRDYIISDAATSFFSISSEHIGKIKAFRDLVLNNDGTLKEGAPQLWASVLSRDPNKAIVRRILKDFSDVTGLDVLGIAEDLAKRRQWDPPLEKMAVNILSMLARFTRFVGRKTAEGQVRLPLTNPKIGAAVIGPTDIGQESGLAVLGLTSDMAEGMGGWVADKFYAGVARGKHILGLQKSHEESRAKQEGMKEGPR